MDTGYLHELEYDMILRIYYLVKSVGIIIGFKHGVLQWDNITIPMNRTKTAKKKKYKYEK